MNILLCIALSTIVSAAVCVTGAFLMLRSLKQRFAQRDLNYTQKFSDAHLATTESEKKVIGKIDELEKEIKALRDQVSEQKPEENAAVDFNAGIAAILGYDPMEVRKKMRENQRSEDI